MLIADISTISSLCSLVVVACSGGLVVIFKRSIQHQYDEKIELHKANLKRDYDVQLEQLRADLQIAAAEKNFRFSHVFEKTASAIANTYKNIVAFRQAVVLYGMYYEGAEQEVKTKLVSDLNETQNKFRTDFNDNKIFIPKTTSDKIGEVLFKLLHLHAKHQTLMIMQNSRANTNAVIAQYESYNELENKVKVLLELLESDFQKILGFPTE